MDPPRLDRDAVLKRYDRLQSRGELLYTPSSSAITFTENNFPFAFRIAPSQKAKPAFPEEHRPSPATSHGTNTPTTASGTEARKIGAIDEYISDIDNHSSTWHLAFVHDTHRIILNKYCIFRPQYILMTQSASHLQTSPLNSNDLRAAWTTLQALERPHYLIYNCAKQAGGSRLHKHMQLFEQSEEELLPDVILRNEKIRKSVPYRYQLDVIPQDLEKDEDVAQWLADTYKRHVEWTAEVLGSDVEAVEEGEEKIVPHNIVLTKRWLITIPRRGAGVGRATANAAGMIGLVWVSEQSIIELWKELGPTKVLATLGAKA